MKHILFLILSLVSTTAWPYDSHHSVQVEVTRKGDIYTLMATINTSLTKCAAYHYLTDYGGARNLPGVIRSAVYRESANKVNVRLHSVLEYTEQPFDKIAFTQLSGDSKVFQGSWDIVPNRQAVCSGFGRSGNPIP